MEYGVYGDLSINNIPKAIFYLLKGDYTMRNRVPSQNHDLYASRPLLQGALPSAADQFRLGGSKGEYIGLWGGTYSGMH